MNVMKVHTTMHTKLTIVLIQHLECCHIGWAQHHLIHPFNAFHHFNAFLFGKDGRTFVFGNFHIGMYAHDDFIAKHFGLSQRIGMTEVYHVVAAKKSEKNRFKIMN